MKKDSYLYKLLILFLTFMKVGAFTFGGGYAMIPLIEDEISNKKKWIAHNEIIDILAISESTPGPIAINAATYVGNKVAGILGGIVATLGLCVPSFVIIFVISFFYKDFIQIKAIQAIFRGLKVAVIILIFSALLKIGRDVKMNLFTVIMFMIGLGVMICANVIPNNYNYWSLCLIAFGALVGILGVLISKKGGKE